jgi:hypothetical protein
MTSNIGVKKHPYGHVSYTRKDPRTGRTIVVQAKGARPQALPSISRNLGVIGEMALKNPKKAVSYIGDVTWNLKSQVFESFPLDKRRALSLMIDDRLRNPLIKLITTAQMVKIGKMSEEEYGNIWDETKGKLARNIKEVNDVMSTGKLPELDSKMAQQISSTPETLKCLPEVLKPVVDLPIIEKSSDVDLVNPTPWQEEARKGAEEARRRKYFLEGKTKPQREMKKALEKLMKKAKDGSEKLFENTNAVAKFKSMSRIGKFNVVRVRDSVSGKTGTIITGKDGNRFASAKVMHSQRFTKGKKAFDRYVITKMVNGKKVIETHDFEITGKGLFERGFEGCIQEAQAKNYVPNAEQAEKLCGWILQEAGINVARQGLVLMTAITEMKLSGEKFTISRGKGGKTPMHQRDVAAKVMGKFSPQGSKVFSNQPGGYNKKEFKGRVVAPRTARGPKSSKGKR